jgi:hypothetical protein
VSALERAVKEFKWSSFIINKLADLEGRYVSKQEEGEVRQQDERYQS